MAECQNNTPTKECLSLGITKSYMANGITGEQVITDRWMPQFREQTDISITLKTQTNARDYRLQEPF